MSALVCATAIALACMWAACGASERSVDASAVVERFQAALDDDEGAAACAELSEETSSKLEHQEGRPCEEAILGLELPAGRAVADASVDVTSASVSLREGGTLFLDEAADGWEISAAGCRPTAPDLPYECELEN